MKNSTVLPITIAALSIGSLLLMPKAVLAETPVEQQSCTFSQSQLISTLTPVSGTAKDLQIAAPQKVNLYCFFGVGTGEKTSIETMRLPIVLAAPKASKADQLTIFRISF